MGDGYRQRYACGNGGRCEREDSVGVEAWKTYETVFAAPPAAMGLSSDQWNKFSQFGDDYGVSQDLTP